MPLVHVHADSSGGCGGEGGDGGEGGRLMMTTSERTLNQKF